MGSNPFARSICRYLLVKDEICNISKNGSIPFGDSVLYVRGGPGRPHNPKRIVGFFIVCYTTAVYVVTWYSTKAQFAEVWRVLDLSGLTPHPRASRQAVRAGQVYLNGNQVNSLKDQVEVGSKFTLEIRFPNRPTRRRTIRLVHQTPIITRARQTVPQAKNYRG